MLMSTILSRVTAPLHRFAERHVDNGDLAYALRAAQVDTAWRAFSFDPTLAGPRGEVARPRPPAQPVHSHPSLQEKAG